MNEESYYGDKWFQHRSSDYTLRLCDLIYDLIQLTAIKKKNISSSSPACSLYLSYLFVFLCFVRIEGKKKIKKKFGSEQKSGIQQVENTLIATIMIEFILHQNATDSSL